MKVILIILLYFLIGAIVEFLLVFSVLMYAKRHSNSEEQFIEVWNKACNLVIIPSLFRTTDINKDIVDIFQLHICTWMFIWPAHIFGNILFIIGIYILKLADRFFYKLTSVLVKR